MGKKTNIADLLGLTPAQEQERLSGLRRLARAILNAIKRVVAFLFGGIVGDIGRDVATVKSLASRAAIGAAYGVDGVGKGLGLGYRLTHGLASGVGGLLGALVPRPPVGPADVAAAAAAQDNRDGRAIEDMQADLRAALAQRTSAAPPARPALSPVETVSAIRDAVGRIQRGDLSAGALLNRLPGQLENWVLLLDEESAARLLALPNGQLWRHVSGVANAPGLLPVAGTSAGSVLSDEEIASVVQRSMRRMKASSAEIIEMAKRPGAAPRPRMPTEPLYGEEAEASFRASPHPAVAY